MKGYSFSEREEVAHVDQLDVKLRVVRLLWKYVEVSTGTPKPNPKEGFEKEKRKHLDGILVQWWCDDQLKEKKFHSHLLVPWWVAQKGKEFAEQWIEEMKSVSTKRSFDTHKTK